MANTSVFTGADGSISLSSPEGLEGESAQGVLDAYELITVGRVQDVRVELESDVKAFHEIGQRYATELRPGNVHVRGTIGRAYINGVLLKLMLGEAAGGRPAGSWVQPAFNITILLDNPANEGQSNNLTIHGAKIDSWDYGIPEDDFVLESVGFKALFVTVEDS
jgi:hypothetical protein